MSAMVYDFKQAARFRSGFDRKAGAARLGQLLERDGYLSTDAIIADGLQKDSPLYPQFDIEPAEALQYVREQEARYLQRVFVSVEIVKDGDGETREVRAVVPVYTREHPDERRYISTYEALTDEDYRDQVLARALGEAIAFRRKYAELQELARIFKAIDALAAKVEKAA